MAGKSLIEELPEIVKRGRKEYERIMQRLQSDNKMLLQTNEYVLPARDESGLFQGKIERTDTEEWKNRLIYGDNIFVMQALLNGDAKTGLPSMRGAIDLIYIDPPFDSKADYRTKITLPTGDIEAKPAVNGTISAVGKMDSISSNALCSHPSRNIPLFNEIRFKFCAPLAPMIISCLLILSVMFLPCSIFIKRSPTELTVGGLVISVPLILSDFWINRVL